MTTLHGQPRVSAPPGGEPDSHLAEVERDLAQMNALLEAAIEKLLASFMAIHRGISRQQSMLQESAADHPEFATCSARMEVLRKDLERHVGEAITGLQFQDMTRQLIQRMGAHLDCVRDDLAPPGTRGPSPRARSPRAVHQHHLECGDVELF